MKHKAKTKNLYVRLTLENHAFVKRMSKKDNASLNKTFNQIIKKDIEQSRGR